MTTRSRSAGRLLLLATTLTAGVFMLAGCGEESGSEYTPAQPQPPAQEQHQQHSEQVSQEASQPASQPVATTPAELSETARAGAALFSANCSQCHGRNAVGTRQGPPLVHQIYEPGHHSNASFVLAVTRGVRQHHWEFGNMPAVPGLAIDEIHAIVCYIRELQLNNGIIDKIPDTTPC